MFVDGYEEHVVPRGSAQETAADASCGDLLRLWGLSLGVIFATVVLFSLSHIVPSIPARGATGPTTFAVNPGGSMCFSNDSDWAALRRSPVSLIEDAVSLGGMSAKSMLTHGTDGSLRSIWKPQLKIKAGSRSSPFNAVILFHLDCLLGLQRAIPAVSMAVDWKGLQDSLSEVAQERMVGRGNWKRWRSTGQVFGAAQLYYEPAVHMNFIVTATSGALSYLGLEESVERLLGAGDYTARERGQRDMVDFLLGNWDRAHNRFYAVDPTTGRSSYVFLDYDNLMLSTTAKTAMRDKLKCQYFRRDVQRLAELTNRGLARLVEDSLEREDHFPAGLSGKRKSPVRFLDLRAAYFLDHVARCIEDYGERFVLGET